MRKMLWFDASPARVSLLCLMGFGLISAGARAQEATPVPAQPGGAAMPKDAKELMQLAAKANSLTGADMQPWHLKASFNVLDDSGNAIDQGTYEEYWAGPRKVRIAFANKTFSQAEFVTEKGTLRSGSHAAQPPLLGQIDSEFTEPVMVNPALLEHWVLGRVKRNMDRMRLVCLSVKGWSTQSGTQTVNGPTYCLDADRPMLMSISNPMDGTEWLRSNVLSFRGHYVPGDFEAVRNGKRVFSAHLDSIETLKSVNEADFAPPPDAIEVPRKIAVSGGVAQGLLVEKTAPEYPVDAKLAGISGTVVLQILIGKDGHVADLKIVSGPPELQQAAMGAVRTWVYRPYLLNGEPVEVNTTVNVVFTLSR
jgi:TonB family protein